MNGAYCSRCGTGAGGIIVSPFVIVRKAPTMIVSIETETETREPLQVQARQEALPKVGTRVETETEKRERLQRGALPKPPPIAGTLKDRTRRRARPDPSPHAFAYTIEDAQAMGGPGRTKLYQLAKSGRLKLIHVGGRTLVDGDSLRALLGVAV
jgi:hypothetical protein